MLIVDIALGGLVFLAAGHTIGIDPGVQFHAPLVGLLDHELQGIPHGIGGLTGFTGEPAGPRLQFAGIGGIGLRPDLPNDCIAVSLLQEVELLNEIVAHLLRRHLGILFLPDDMHPRTAELMLGQLALLNATIGSGQTACQCHHEHRQEKKSFHIYSRISVNRYRPRLSEPRHRLPNRWHRASNGRCHSGHNAPRQDKGWDYPCR